MLFPKNEFESDAPNINANLVKISEWLTANKIQINIDKTKDILYSFRGNYKFETPIKINNN